MHESMCVYVYVCRYKQYISNGQTDRQTSCSASRRGGDCKGLEWLRTDIEHPSTKKSYTGVYVEGVGLITD